MGDLPLQLLDLGLLVAVIRRAVGELFEAVVPRLDGHRYQLFGRCAAGRGLLRVLADATGFTAAGLAAAGHILRHRRQDIALVAHHSSAQFVARAGDKHQIQRAVRLAQTAENTHQVGLRQREAAVAVRRAVVIDGIVLVVAAAGAQLHVVGNGDTRQIHHVLVIVRAFRGVLNKLVQLLFQLIILRLQRLLVLRLLQQLQLIFHDLQVLRLPVIVDLGALHGGLGQCGVIAHQRRALLDAVALLDPHLLHRLALGDVDLLQFVRGHHAAGVGGVPPVVGHGALVDGVYVHVAPLGVPGDGQSAPHRAAHAHHAGGGDNGLFQLFAHARLLAVGALFADMQLFPQRQLLTHSRHLPTVRRPVWS